jgi:hypothetical protein
VVQNASSGAVTASLKTLSQCLDKPSHAARGLYGPDFLIEIEAVAASQIPMIADTDSD